MNTRRIAGATIVWSSAIFSCGVDERPLSVAVVGSAGGAAARDGISEPGGAGESTRGGARNESGAGVSGVAGGGNAGVTGGAGSSNGGHGAVGETEGGSAGFENAAGASGATFSGPCGDIDDDRVDDCSETLAQNTRFDTGLVAWLPELNADAIWDRRDASAESSSGSMRVSNTVPVAAVEADVDGRGGAVPTSHGWFDLPGRRTRLPLDRAG